MNACSARMASPLMSSLCVLMIFIKILRAFPGRICSFAPRHFASVNAFVASSPAVGCFDLDVPAILLGALGAAWFDNLEFDLVVVLRVVCVWCGGLSGPSPFPGIFFSSDTSIKLLMLRKCVYV